VNTNPQWVVEPGGKKTDFQIQYEFIFLRIHYINSDCRNSSVDIATFYWLVGPGMEMW